MRTFTWKIASGAARQVPAHRPSAGFTLLELLVVAAIVAILTGALALSFAGVDEEQRLRGMAERIGARVELARQYSLQRNREWGIYVEEDGYRFAELDPQQGRWVEQAERPFRADGLTPRISFRIEVDGFASDAFEKQESEQEALEGEELEARRRNLPDIIVFSSGEVTPFRWYLEPAWGSAPWVVASDGLAQTAVQRAGA